MSASFKPPHATVPALRVPTQPVPAQAAGEAARQAPTALTVASAGGVVPIGRHGRELVTASWTPAAGAREVNKTPPAIRELVEDGIIA